MKLASVKSDNRDGLLVLVDAELQRISRVTDIASTLQVALDNWQVTEPLLRARYAALNNSEITDTLPFEATEFCSPLPRAFQFLDGSVYLSHMKKARQARGAAMPDNYETEPLMYQGLSDSFLGPKEDVPFASDSIGVDCEAEIGVIVDDVPLGVSASEASTHIKLVCLLNDFTARALTQTELPKGFGFIQSKPASSFAPVAVSPSSLGSYWRDNRLCLPVKTKINDLVLGAPHAGTDMYFDFADLIAHAAKTRRLSAGTIIGAGAVSNDDVQQGYACIAEARVEEQNAEGQAKTAFLKFGDRVQIEVTGEHGEPVFGAIDQQIVKHTKCPA